MRITFCGAARTVTGSCYLLEIGDRRILVDCGMFQGGREMRERNLAPLIFEKDRERLPVTTGGRLSAG